MTPKISIITPVYKAENSLSKCIDSVINQSYINWELILIDDGSPDKSGRICDSYADIDFRIKSLHQKNEGPSAARNLGIDNALGEWIAFLDSDDYVDPDWLESYLEIINHTNKVDLIYQGYKELNNIIVTEYYIPNLNELSYIQKIHKLELDRVYGFTWIKLYKRSIIDKFNIRFDTTLSLKEDHLFTLEFCLYANHIYKTKGISYIYNIHEGSLMKSKHNYFQLERMFTKLREARLVLLEKFPNAEYEKFAFNDYLSAKSFYLFEMYNDKTTISRSDRCKRINDITFSTIKNKHFIGRRFKLIYILKKMRTPSLITDFIISFLSKKM